MITSPIVLFAPTAVPIRGGLPCNVEGDITGVFSRPSLGCTKRENGHHLEVSQVYGSPRLDQSTDKSPNLHLTTFTHSYICCVCSSPNSHTRTHTQGKVKAKLLTSMTSKLTQTERYLGDGYKNKSPVVTSALQEGVNQDKVVIAAVTANVPAKERVP